MLLSANPDIERMHAYRMQRVRDQLKQLDVAAALLYDPINIRYATGSRNMAVWTLHNPARYLFIATDGPAVLFDYHNCEFMAEGLAQIDEVRPACPWFFFSAGPRYPERAKIWAMEVADLVTANGGGNRRLALDHCDFTGVAALQALGIEVVDGQAPLEYAREIKSPDELAAARCAIEVCELGMQRMQQQLTPGITENALWSWLHQVNIEHDGEWIETRLLSSGPRTNPWFQESSPRELKAGELMAFDTDLIGPYGMCADISRTYLCGDQAPSAQQQRLYRLAYEQIQHNIAALKPGLTFREYSENAWVIPDAYKANAYGSVIHGVGLCDEWPRIPQPWVFAEKGSDGVFEPGMTLCVESYIGELDGTEGVKLEEQVLITDTSVELMSRYPFDERLLGREF